MSDILSVNIGSSSLKFALYTVLPNQQVEGAHVTGLIEGLEPGGQPRLQMVADGQRSARALDTGQDAPMLAALQALQEVITPLLGGRPLRAVAHRIVHGGARFREAVRLTPETIEALQAYNSLAPLHQPHNLAGVRACMQAFPDTPQIGCFDTAFHATALPLETRFALPEALYAQGVQRYGFHGLSYDYVAGRMRQHSPRTAGRMLMAHLGNGSSLCAAVAGRSVGTTMGFSALDGLMMGTRCGTIDAGVLLYLMEQGWDHARISRLLYKESGLLGVSGLSADMRTLRASQDPQARLATDLYVHRIRREGGALVAVMQGLDVVVFTGGIGEHDAVLRQQVCDALAYLGVHIDATRNQHATGDAVRPIHAAHSTIEVWVVPTDEGLVAAQDALAFLPNSESSP